MLLAALRNCTYLVADLNKDVADEDLVAIAQLVDAIEVQDRPLYFATLMNVSKRVDHARVAKILPTHQPLVEMCIRQMISHTEEINPGNQKIIHDETDLYDYDLDEDEEDEGEDLQAVDSPASPTSGEDSPASP